jgi:uncharacterized protein YneF (UPF0154 family)
MKDYYIILPITAILFCVLVLGIFIGGKFESSRIYNRCMKDNGAMIHNEAVAKCSESIK